ncbi:6371_t:CDS:2 [Gigaspora margarita]|uniref:6371_t:CDS:1 n=1 Tax=Gigaspora margarita TaxID=4874 RepID=A0ABN7VV17_GIGMA|nr:6371_t:CDS:2 [Gigaspora margarita]
MNATGRCIKRKQIQPNYTYLEKLVKVYEDKIAELQKQIIINENNSNSFIFIDLLVKELLAKIILLEEKTKEIANLTNTVSKLQSKNLVLIDSIKSVDEFNEHGHDEEQEN